MSYATESEILAVLPQQHLTDVLDDDGTGEASPGLLDQILMNADLEVDGFIESSVVLPLASPPPKSIRRAALVFALEMLHQRRQIPDAQNPWKAEADRWRSFLMKVGAGGASLEAASEVSEPASGGMPRIKMRSEI